MNTVAAFDFDGTITYHDTIVHFLLFAEGPLKGAAKLALLSPVFLAYAAGLQGRQATKERALASFFQGMAKEELDELGQSFARGPLKKHIKQSAIEKLMWHRQQGHLCVLVSASIETYLKPWSSDMGFTHCLASRLAYDSDGRATGRLDGLNCWGQEKVRRLAELLGPKEHYILYAYGDSLGDQALLKLADHPSYRLFS